MVSMQLLFKNFCIEIAILVHALNSLLQEKVFTSNLMIVTFTL